MKRGSFLKSLLGIAVAPKVLTEIDLPIKNIVPIGQSNATGVAVANKGYIGAIQFLDKRELLNDVLYQYRVGDRILCIGEEGFYVVTKIFADEVTAMYMNNSKKPISFKLGDKRFVLVFRACKEVS